MIKLRRINPDWQRFVALLFGCFPHEENFRSEHSGIFSCEWNSIFRNLRKRRHPREVYQKTEKSLTGNFRPIDFLSATLEFSVEWFKFPKFSNFRIFRKLFKGVFVPSVFLLERARRLPKFSQISYWEFQFHLVLLEFPEFLVELFAFRKFRIFFHTSSLLFETSDSFWLKRKYPLPAVTEIQTVSTNLS